MTEHRMKRCTYALFLVASMCGILGCEYILGIDGNYEVSPPKGPHTCANDIDCPSGNCGLNHLCVEAHCSDGVKNGTESDIDCGGPSCNPCAPGKLCVGQTDCVAAACIDGVCCQEACDGECVACASTKTERPDGECAPIVAGTDPDEECSSQDSSTCGNSTGFCNGMGGCQKHAVGAICASASCVDGTQTNARACDGLGNCTDTGSIACAPYVCGSTMCLTSCSDDPQCDTDHYCVDATCVPRKSNGQACSKASECQTGFCVDGVCCNDACTGECRACVAAKTSTSADGTCGDILGGIDPDGECVDMGATSCSTTGECSGAGSCALYGAGTVCVPASCSGNTAVLANTCDGIGNCIDNGVTNCAPYFCGNGACGTMCSTDVECISGTFCNGAVCTPLLPVGASCSGTNQCETGFCVDGFCCNDACDGICEACSVAKQGSGTNGVCGGVANGTDPDNDCTAQSATTCGHDGFCNGNGVCRVYASGTVCAASTCTNGTQSNADTCDGTGQCIDKGTVACVPYACGTGACLTTCTSNAHCATGASCVGGQCVPICGDGIKLGGEACDDNNTSNGDGCSSGCIVEPGWICTGAPSSCMTICGDGIKVGAEECDDGNTSDGDRCSPTCVLQEIVQVSTGNDHTCARLNTGIVKCWGRNASGQLGLGDTVDRGDGANEMGSNLLPVNLGAGKTANFIATGTAHSCAVLNDGNIKCWGNNSNGQLGNGNTTTQSSPVGPINLGAGLTASVIGTGSYHTCAILNDGTVKCWGYNPYGQLGIGTQTSQASPAGPINLGSGKTAVAIAAGVGHSCAILNDGTVKCWGYNAYGQVGIGNTTTPQTSPMGPLNLGSGKTAISIAAGASHTCAILNDGSVKCWGFNGSGQLGIGNTTDQTSPAGPVDLGAGKTAIAIAAGGSHTCAVLNDTSLMCWGSPAGGQLGIGAAGAPRLTPVGPVNLGTGMSAVKLASRDYHTCALLNVGALKCWGANGYGQLGLGDTAVRGASSGTMGDNLPTVKLFSNLW